jgi:hypothetical protein
MTPISRRAFLKMAGAASAALATGAFVQRASPSAAASAWPPPPAFTQRVRIISPRGGAAPVWPNQVVHDGPAHGKAGAAASRAMRAERRAQPLTDSDAADAVIGGWAVVRAPSTGLYRFAGAFMPPTAHLGQHTPVFAADLLETGDGRWIGVTAGESETHVLGWVRAAALGCLAWPNITRPAARLVFDRRAETLTVTDGAAEAVAFSAWAADAPEPGRYALSTRTLCGPVPGESVFALRFAPSFASSLAPSEAAVRIAGWAGAHEAHARAIAVHAAHARWLWPLVTDTTVLLVR